MSRSVAQARQNHCLALSRSVFALKMTLWPESGSNLARSGRKFSYGPQGKGEKRRGPMPPGLFLFFLGGHLPQTSARSKQYLPVIFARLALFRQNFHESLCRKLLAI